jgi:proteic killer suppression protein
LKVPPANRLEKLKANLKDFYSIRINDHWRMIFKWVDGEARDVPRPGLQASSGGG